MIDDTSCKLLRMTTPRDAADKEKCPDPRISTENLMTGHRVLNRLAALPNFKDIEAADREEVCELFDSLQTAHATIADAAGSLAPLGQRLHPHQFQFLLKHSIHPHIQLQIPAHLCHPGELRFEKQYLSNDELYEQCCVNTLLPRLHHPALDSIPPKHPTRALTAAIHYHLWKRMCTKFNASQTEIADLFQVERKTFFTSITGHEYDPGRKPTKSKKLKTSPKKDTSTEKHSEEPQPSQSTTTEVDLKTPPLEDIRPKKKFRFKDPDANYENIIFQGPQSYHFLNLSHFSKSLTKILLHSHLFKFPRSNVSEALILNIAMLGHFLFQLCTCSGMCSLYTFFFQLCTCSGMCLLYLYVFKKKKKKKKKDLSFGLGKKLKVMPQLSCYLSFLLGKGGKPLYLKSYFKNFKVLQVCLPTDPYNALV